MLPPHPTTSDKRANNKRHDDSRVTPLVCSTGPRKSENKQRKPNQEERLAPEINTLQPGHEARPPPHILDAHPRPPFHTHDLDGLGAEQIPAQHEKHDEDAEDRDGQVDGETPAPVDVGQVASHDGAEPVARPAREGEDGPVARVLLQRDLVGHDDADDDGEARARGALEGAPEQEDPVRG